MFQDFRQVTRLHCDQSTLLCPSSNRLRASVIYSIDFMALILFPTPRSLAGAGFNRKRTRCHWFAASVSSLVLALLHQLLVLGVLYDSSMSSFQATVSSTMIICLVVSAKVTMSGRSVVGLYDPEFSAACRDPQSRKKHGNCRIA